MDVTRTVVAMVLGIVLPLGWQLADRRRLPREGRDRSWNLASWAAALYAFGPLSMLGWFVVTRRGWRRLLGIPALVVVAAVVTAVDLGLERLLAR